jgi:hypothetical protein
MSLIKLSLDEWTGIISLIPSRESLVNDIPAGDGKTASLVYSVTLFMKPFTTFK